MANSLITLNLSGGGSLFPPDIIQGFTPQQQPTQSSNSPYALYNGPQGGDAFSMQRSVPSAPVNFNNGAGGQANPKAFFNDPSASPQQQLEQAWSQAEQGRNAYLNLAGQLNGQAYQEKSQFQPLSPPSQLGNAPASINTAQAPAPTQTPDPSAQLQQQLAQAQLNEQQFLQQLQAQQAQQQQQQAAMQAAQPPQAQQPASPMPAPQAGPPPGMDSQQQAQQATMQQQPMAQQGAMDPQQQAQMQQQQAAQQAAMQQQMGSPGGMDPQQQAMMQQQQAAQQAAMNQPQQSPQGQQAGMPPLVNLPIEELNRMLANPNTLQEKVDAMEAIGTKGVRNSDTFGLLETEAMADTSRFPAGQQQDEANVIRCKAIWTLAMLNRDNQVPTAELPGLAQLKTILQNKNDNPEVRTAAAQAIQYLNRSSDPIIREILSSSKNLPPNAKAIVQSTLAGQPLALVNSQQQQAPAFAQQQQPQQAGGMPPVMDPQQQQALAQQQAMTQPMQQMQPQPQ